MHSRDRPAVVAGVEEDEILDEGESGDIVETALVDREPRVFLLAEQRAQIPNRGVLVDRDDVGARRHHFADERIAEVHDTLQQTTLFSLNNPFLLAAVEVRLRDVVGFLRFLIARWLRRIALRLGPRSGDPAAPSG